MDTASTTDDYDSSCSIVAFDDAEHDVDNCEDCDDDGMSEFPPLSPIDSDSEQDMPVHHRDLWFPDGSVVLATRDLLFKVHMSMLTRHSVFFRDMFTLPQPHHESQLVGKSEVTTTNNSCIEGCPVVELHDASEDLTNLLLALYDGPKFGNNDRNDFRAVSGILRLAHKYLIDSLREKALAHLSVAWPSTLEGWDKREDLVGEYYVDIDVDRYYPSPVDVINLAREINAPSLLVSAFYDLSRYQFSQLLPTNTSSASCPSSPIAPPPISLAPLSLTDTQKLVLGKESSQYAIISLIRSIGTDIYSSSSHRISHTPASPPHHNTHPLNLAHHHQAYPHALPRENSPNLRHKRAGSSFSCSSTCKRDVGELVALSTQHYLFDRERGANDPLYVAEELGQLMSTEMDGVECKACARALEVWARRERDKLWRSIPGWFRLEV